VYVYDKLKEVKSLSHTDFMSIFSWIDYSEKQRRQILEAIDLFREKDTRDELGISGIRDTISEMLFPGTGSLQTRARYFFFVPWMYLGFEAARVSSTEIERKSRAYEIGLIDRLADSSDPAGTIGILARSSLQRVPSSIYWNGLKLLHICQFPGSQAEYHRSLDRLTAIGKAIRRNDDGEVVGGQARAWHTSLPAAPATFPLDADFALTYTEAHYLKGRVLENHRHSLFAFMLDHADADADFAWEHQASEQSPIDLKRQINHARCFSEVMYGAAILYNLFLGELEPRRENVIEDCDTILNDWLDLIEDRRQSLSEWDRQDFWKLLTERLYVPTTATRLFVDMWCSRVLNGYPKELRAAAGIKELIFGREAQIKGPLARCSNRRAREMWRGDAGLGRMDFRWSNARVVLRDIASGLAGGNA
jgi:hypothetical protein